MEEQVVNSWLLNWNPSNPTWQWEEQEDEYGYKNTANIVKNGGTIFFSWRCVSKKVKLGDRIFIVKLGAAPRGVFATGYAASDSYENYYTDDNGEDVTERLVDICITGFLDYHSDELISHDLLKRKFPDQQWSPQGSGISIKPDAARWLIEHWNYFHEAENCNDDAVIPETVSVENEPVIWKISHGTPSTSGISKELRALLAERNTVIVNQITSASIGQKISQGDSYMYEIKAGDFFYLCYAGEIVLLGQFVDNQTKMNQEMFEKWGDDGWIERKYKVIALSQDHEKYTGTKKIWTSNYNSTCVKVTDNALFEELILKPYFGLTLTDLDTTDYHEPYIKQDFLNQVYMTSDDYDTLTELLRNKQNIILQGAPGVGKTFTAKRLAYAMMGEKDDSRIEFIQFHQSYSYEDFIMGYRPDEDGGFTLTNGVFYEFCNTARNDPDRDYFFIIDEINRGNLSKIFGELLMLIEKDYRTETARLAYKNEHFSVPKNLYLIGMMNTADRSLAMIDYALRRRFSFFDMMPGFKSDGFAAYRDSLQNDTFNALIAEIMQLNHTIAQDSSLGDGFCIGHSYFCNLTAETCTDARLRSIVKYDIIPLLREYWFDDRDAQQAWADRLCGVFHDE